MMKKALLVIDYINGIIDGSCKEYAEQHPIVENTNKVIAFCRKNNIPIYFIRLAFDNEYNNLPKHSKAFNTIKTRGLFQLGQKESEFVDDLDIQPGDPIFNKTAASPYNIEELKKILRSQQIECLIFTGVATDNAINIGVREAHDAGYYTVIVSDACGASSENFHQWSLSLLEKIANEILATDFLLKNLVFDL